jgi:hypothetical protein
LDEQLRLTPVMISLADGGWDGTIEEGGAASKSPHYKFGYFFLFPSKYFLPILLKIQLLQYLNHKH